MLGGRLSAECGESDGQFLMRTGADELMCVSSIYDHDTRVRSFSLALEARVC